MKFLVFLLTLLSTSSLAFAQQGTLSGKIKDKTTGEAIIGATIAITGTGKGTVTDVDGNYNLTLDAGTYKVAVTYVAYKTQNIDNVKIQPGQKTNLNVTLEESSNALEAVTVVGAKQTNTEIALISDIKRSNVVVSGMSSEQITRSLDRDAAETVKRIPGVTVMNDKYIVIRGMAERYNTVMLNDAFTPSTEVDVKSFSFDLLPTSVIDRIMIYKSGSPELPGDFGGGVIKVYTKNLVNENSTTLGVSTSYRGNTTLQNFNSNNVGKTDMLGFDDGTRTLPGSFPKNINSGTTSQIVNLARTLPNSWNINQTKALPDLRLSLGINRRFDFKNIDFSNITAISYSNTRLHTSGTRTKYQNFNPDVQRSDKQFDYIDDLSSSNVRLGVVHNWSARINNNNRIEFRNLFNQLGTSQILNRTGVETFNGLDQRNYSLRYESRSMYSSQLQGTHSLPNEKTTLTWTGSYAYTNRNEPDYRRVRTQRPTGTDDPFLVAYKFTPSLADAGRFYSKLTESNIALNGQIEHKFVANDSLTGNSPTIKAGFYAEQKNRDFSARYFSYSPASPSEFNTSITALPLDQVFAVENINTTNGWTITEGTNPSDTYKATNQYLAGFISGVLPIGQRFISSGGVRVEHNVQRLRSTVNVDKPVTRILPSVNLSYNFNQRSLLRLGSSISLNRPEFRELAPFTYFDFENLWEIKGNPNLKTAQIYNADLRYEFYPNPTEIISFGVFGKYFVNSIERYFENTNIGNSISFQNSDRASNYGVETEIRKSLLNYSSSKFIQNLSLVLNASLIKSQVEFKDEADGLMKTRALTGQSPYIVNTGIYYQDNAKGLQFNLLYNVVGKRIFVIGSYQNPTIYEMPRNIIDLSFTKSLGQHFELKGGIQDILNQKIRLIQDSDYNNKITEVDEAVQTVRRGSYSTIGISYKF
ncbi:TonB-dependent receptor [Adhaeribacter aquaticus]|uniref:TonB-dependent receptor n=1 Tax=Adhaeribacter aquaticus TaxID=299567 RepID=UPI0004259478|nr:TonB-dependent receptor [Adhaeribacter aquaticus]